MNRKLWIYVAGPYTARTKDQTVSNVTRAIDAGVVLLRKGHYPFIPHLTHFVDERCREIGESTYALEYEDYIQWDLAWLSKCDAILYLGSSPGADREMKAAVDSSMQIFYSIDDVPEVLGSPDR